MLPALLTPSTPLLGTSPAMTESVLGGIPATTQCTKFRPGASMSRISSTSSRVPSGAPDHCSGGEIPRPEQVYTRGIACPEPNAGLRTAIEAGATFLNPPAAAGCDEPPPQLVATSATARRPAPVATAPRPRRIIERSGCADAARRRRP